jgi:REP element-mobilizing transposase RayT
MVRFRPPFLLHLEEKLEARTAPKFRWGRRSCPSAFISMMYSRRRLPHWVPDNAFVFVTWRLAGTLPHSILERKQGSPGERFAAADRELDRSVCGPLWLKDERVAQTIVEALYYGAQVKAWYELHAWVVMPNHVHVIWKPIVSMSRILHWLKSVTAKRAKRILGLDVKAFWQDESYDHWIRSDKELSKLIRYVELNPVKAGLARSIEAWPWSSANFAALDESLTQATRSPAPPNRSVPAENV